MIENKETGEWDYDDSEVPGVEYTLVDIDGNIITGIPSEWKARCVQRRRAGSIIESSNAEFIKETSKTGSHMWDYRKKELNIPISDEVETITYEEYLYGKNKEVSGLTI